MSQTMNSSSNPSVSFAGCGFLGLYHVGVASCFREYAPISNGIILGASAGALAAMALCLKLPLGESTSELLSVAIKARSRALGPFHPSFDVNKIIYDGLVKTLPEDCHKKATGRLYISVTRVSDGQNVLINQFDCKEDLIRAIQCSCFIPFWSGIVPPKFHGIAYMDGGFSDNLPVMDKNTITVSPFSGESDICPQDETYNLFQMNLVNTSICFSPSNFYRFSRILFPAHPEILSKMCQQGFDDALRFLQRNNKIACTRCLAIQSSFTLGEDEDIDEDYQSTDSGCENWCDEEQQHHSAINCTNCKDCQYRRQIAVLDSLPDAVVQAIQEACDQVNKGVINWLFRHRPMKLLSILSIPYLLPIDITIVMFCKVWQQVPQIKKELKTSLFNLLSFLRSIVVKMESKRHLYSAKFNCQLAVTEFDYSNEDCPQVYAQTSPNIRKISTIKLTPKRKLTNTVTNNINPKPSARKMVEKAHSFSAGNSSARKRSQISLEGNPLAVSTQDLFAYKNKRLQTQRKSYAGTHDYYLGHSLDSEIDRRKSMIEMTPKVKPPERVISKMNFGFSVDLKSKSDEELHLGSTSPTSSDSDQNSTDKVLDAFQRLEDIDQTNAIEMANKALDWERECLQKYKEFADPSVTDADSTDINKMIELTKKQEALMAFYYTDENNRVKVTEIFNISPEEEISAEEKIAEDIPDSKQMIDDEEDGLRAELISSKSLLSPNKIPSNQRRRKKSVLID